MVINFNSVETKPIIKVGEIVKFAKMKRLCMKVVNSNLTGEYEFTYSLKPYYNPAPRSILKNGKSVFSKIKVTLLK